MNKKLGALLLGICLLLSGIPAALAAAGTPAVTLSANQVNGGEILEVSLMVDQVGLTSLHTVLRYDPTALTLLDWDAAQTPVEPEPGAPSTAGATIAPGYASGKPSLVYRPAKGEDAYLYFAATTRESKATLEAGRALVTVRFKLSETAFQAVSAIDLEAETLDLTTLNALISVVEDEQTAQTVAASVPYPVTANSETNLRYAWAGEADVAPYAKLEAPVWTLKRAASLYPAGSGAGGAVATFFDWDGRVVDAIALPTDAGDLNAAVTAVQEGLSEKPGYDFDRWLRVYQIGDDLRPLNGTFTSNLDGLDEKNPDLADFKTAAAGKEAIFVQAAYKANDTLRRIGGDKPAAYVLDVENIYYTRYGAATEKDGKYSITLTFRRTLEEGGKQVGVQRAVEPGVIAAMTPSAGELADLFSFVSVENQEAIQVELVPTRDISKVSFYLVDVNGVAAWPNAASRSGSSYSIPAADFIKYGTANYICEQAILSLNGDSQSEWDKYVDAQTFKDALGKAVGNVETAKTAVMTKLESVKETEGDYRVLTYAEFQQIVSGQ